MKRRAVQIMAVVLTLCFAHLAIAQTDGCRIRVEVKNYASDSLWLGESFGRRAVPVQLMHKLSEGAFEIQLAQLPENTCSAIVYELSTGGKKAFTAILLPPDRCNVEVVIDVKSPGGGPDFKNSPENTLFWQHADRVAELLDKRDDCNNNWRLLQDEETLQALQQAEKNLEDYQESFLREHSQSFAAKFVSPFLFRTPPEPTDQMSMPEVAVMRQNWFRAHFLEGVDIASTSFWRNPLAISWLDFFTFKTAMPSPDSVRWHVDEVIQRLSPNPAAQHYYLNYMLNSFEKMSRFSFDEVFIYLVDKYVKTEMTGGYSQATREEKIEAAEKIDRLRIGKPLPKATLYTEDGSPVALEEIDAPFTLLMFFQPDCSHCKKETPIIKRLAEQYRAEGLKVVLICGKSGDKIAGCWQYKSTMSLPDDWLMLADGKGGSRFRSLYNIDGYPRLFLLDKNKTILYRRGGSATEVELEKVFKVINSAQK